MKEGIDRRPNADAIRRMIRLLELALELKHKDGMACVCTWCEALEQRKITGRDAVFLDFNRANAIAGERYGTEWKLEQRTLARELFYLRRAVSNDDFPGMPEIFRCQCLNNLGRRLTVAGRFVEALDCWRRVLEVCPNFGMSLGNSAATLADYAARLEDPNTRTFFLWMAHKQASAAIAPTAIYTHTLDENSLHRSKKIQGWIESFLDINGIDAESPLTWDGNPPPDEEARAYRHWCLSNYLYLDPGNDLGPYPIAAMDSFGLPSHVILIDAADRFESFFDQMKQEYVSARWLLYEGLTARTAHFSDKDVLLYATKPRPSLCLAVEKIKSAYKTAYSLFDKIAFFVNAYMELRIPANRVTFRTLWTPGDNKPLRGEFDSATNWGFCALYWLTKDFFEKDTDEVAEPQARYLRNVRQYIEHKYLRVTEVDPVVTPPTDLALTISRKQFEAKALHLLKLARSALIYLCIGVGFEEERREKASAGAPVEEIPRPDYIPDAEKV